ncbi:CGNR zinc finger domain-containing protein [Catellatospora sichuanensis]|uniref:CGNR zinc finger domain-containing protein n=1 Tax=Catellatospora sichuanensis TaxID=1969805 RepID=UPI00118386CB|nr:CGNR zinc finger domain-containing protein [Catellatospora sichuanensis]
MEPGFVLRPPSGGVFRFDPGTLWLDLLVSGGPGDLAVFETLHAPADLATWSELCRLRLDPARVHVTEAELAAVVRLRNGLWELARALIHDRPAPPGITALVDDAAARSPLAPRLQATGARFDRVWTLPATGTQLLSTVARDVVDVLTGPYADRVRECGGQRCGLVFLDTSRPGSRRWCSMERCGNRSKVRALRERRAPEPG